MIRQLLCQLLLVAIVAGGEPAGAEEPNRLVRATALVRELTLSLQVIHQDAPDLAHARARLRELLEAYFDLGAMAEGSVGAVLSAAPLAEQDAFLVAYREYLIAIVLGRFSLRGGVAIEIVGARELPGSRVRVVSRIIDGQGRSKELDWLVGPSEPPRVDDMILEGVRLRAQLRAEFAAVLERNNQRLGALIEAMAQASTTDGP